MLDSIEDNDYNNLMGHNTSLGHKIFVAFLNALDGGFQHVLGLAIAADANGQLDSPRLRPSKKG